MAEMSPQTKTAGKKPRPNNSSSRYVSQSVRRVRVFDCRPECKDVKEKIVDATGKDLDGFLENLSKVFEIDDKDTFVLTTTDRSVIDGDVFCYLEDGITLQLLRTADQELPAATQEHIKYVPHYHTLVQSGMYEYYASEGQQSLPYAFAELIDNALSATSKKEGRRSIEICLLFDESQGKPAVVVSDNGCGMTSKQLNNWAVYRLSKFNRSNSTFQSDHSTYVRPTPVPRSLNSDISFFGVGGKQAVFYIGQSVRIITKPEASPDVHEFVMSKEDFERKEKNKEDIYCGVIRNRKPGDSDHVVCEEELFLRDLVGEETKEGKESFTHIVITGIQPDHITYLKHHFNLWTRELAHIYHYYVHGIHGNNKQPSFKRDSEESNVDIEISLVEKSKSPRRVNLRNIGDDMQTLYINSSCAVFEFRAQSQREAIVEGFIRYHPFLYDRETYPQDPYAFSAPVEEEDDDDCLVLNPDGRGKRPIFECYWNGRLIPYTTIAEFEWCACVKKGGVVPAECYNRISGVLFTNDGFQVSTNKLTFMDLELQLRDKDTIFTRVINGQEQRVKIQREFTNWLKECHEKHDKQIKFMGFQGVTSRTDVTSKRLQHPWARYTSISWHGNNYRSGQYVKSVKTHPLLFGTIKEFLLFGDHEGDVYGTGGYVQITMQPKELYNEVRTIPIFKIDRQATTAAIKKNIEDELAKLPSQIKVTWPEGNSWEDYSTKPVGTALGPIQVLILNKKGESMSKLPLAGNAATRKLLVELTVTWHSPKGDIQTNSHIGVYAPKWDYWFKKMENLNKLGKYTLQLQTILNESSATVWAGKQLPNCILNFTLTEGEPVTFSVEAVSSPVQVGLPFPLSLEFKDEFDHPSRPMPHLKPKLHSSTLEVSHDSVVVNGATLLVKGVRVRGLLKTKVHQLNVTVEGLRSDSQSVDISVLPGLPYSLRVLPEEEPVTMENRNALSFRVEVLDQANNITTHSKLIVRSQIVELPGVAMEAVDCSNTGVGELLSKPITLDNIKTDKIITVKFDLPNHKSVTCVKRKVCVQPSRCVWRMEVYRALGEGSDGDVMVLKNQERIDWTAGDMLGDLHYRLYDQADRPLPLSTQIAQNIKVNWSASLKVSNVAQGLLPPVGVPTLAQGEQFYQLTYRGQPPVETSFIIVPRPDEPECLKVTLTESSVRLGEVLADSAMVELTDQYGNKTDALTEESMKELEVSGEGLDTTSLTVQWQEQTHSVRVSGLRFANVSTGFKEVRFAWQRFEEFVRIRINAGPPAKLIILDGPDTPVQVLNGQGVATPFTLQICDEWGNPSPDKRVVITLKPLSHLKVKASVTSQPVDGEGRATFTLTEISAPKGSYELEFRGSLNGRRISSPLVPVTVIPDARKPVSITMDYDKSATFVAGGIFPVFALTVVSEEGAAVAKVNPGSISMLLWSGAAGESPPANARNLKGCKAKKDEREECVYFRDKEIPEQIGKYTIQFVLNVNKTQTLWSNQLSIKVIPGKPVKLLPDTPAATPVVSNGNVLANRTLLESLSLRIMDAYNNPAAEDCNGNVCVSLESPSNGTKRDLPVFDGNSSTLTFPLKNGQAHIKKLALAENSPGSNGVEYMLVFQADVLDLPPYQLAFRFYNDVENQKQMSALSKRKDRLSLSIEAYNSLFQTNNQLGAELRGQFQIAEKKLIQCKYELHKSGLEAAPSTRHEVDALINQKKMVMEHLKSRPRRTCGLADPFSSCPDVLGKVAHLAKVEDDDAAKVISWHLLGDMDCVVTVTTVAAKKIYDDTQGRQQVMPLETVFYKSSQRPLPHIRNGINTFTPVGKPVFARDLLIFPNFSQQCQMVFGSLLGDTILIDDLDSANHYRKGVVQSKIQCPTLLTRQGDRIRSNGKFGGLQNKAPSIEKLRGHIFGAPLPQQYFTISSDVELLQQYGSALEKYLCVQGEYQVHQEYLKSPEMQQKQADLTLHKSQLEEIEKALASTPKRTPLSSTPNPDTSTKRTTPTSDPSGETSSRPPSKRARLKPHRLLD